MSQTPQDLQLHNWKHDQELAEAAIPILGKMYRDQGIVPVIYGQRIANTSTIGIINAHRYVAEYRGAPLALAATFPIIEALSGMRLAPTRVDVGKLAVAYAERGAGQSLDDFLRAELAVALDRDREEAPRDVVLFGFGRIGRLLARLLVERTGGGHRLRLRAVVVRKGKGNDLEKRASLLRRDSIHGHFDGIVTVDEESQSIIANGNVIRMIYADAPDKVDYTAYGIHDALVVDNTGKWSDEEGLARHLNCPGASRVLLTAPGKGEIKNIVYGVNHGEISDADRILSAASCTTNAIVPVLKVINERYGINTGHVETVHSYTNDQNLIDNYHAADRRGRAAPLNMVITSTGAAKAVAKVLPELAGKLTGNAIRVPTPNVSMAILNLSLGEAVEKDALNAFLREAALNSSLRDQIDYTASTEVVSSDMVGSRHACIVDGQATLTNGNHCVLYIWYDNEFGYSCQVVRVIQELCGIRIPNLPR